MNWSVFYGILIPFLGTSFGAACVFFMKKEMADMAAIPAHIARGILQSCAIHRTNGTHSIWHSCHFVRDEERSNSSITAFIFLL